MKLVRENENNCWAIAYIDPAKIPTLKRELRRYPQYCEITPYIPEVKILKKTLKGKPVYDRVPMLFNYGFFNIPRKRAINIEYLNYLKRDLSCLAGWVFDPANKTIRKSYSINEQYLDCHVPVATTTHGKIKEFREMEKANCLYSGKDLGKLNPGMLINLKGFPFEGLTAEFINLSKSRKEAEVRLVTGMQCSGKITVSLENIFFTLYRDSHNQNIETSVHESLNAQRLVDRAYYNAYVSV